MAESTLQRLTGGLQLFPGVARPHNLVNNRPDVVARLTRGHAAKALPGLLGTVFNLCGHAHRLCAHLALSASRGHDDLLNQATSGRLLQIETLREHLRRIHLDWPVHLAADAATARQLQTRASQGMASCPLPWQEPPGQCVRHLSELRSWFEAHLVGMPPVVWLERWEQEGSHWLDAWCESGTGWLPHLLRHCRGVARRHQSPDVPLWVHRRELDLREFADQLFSRPDLVRKPLWRGVCADTGSWSRLHGSKFAASDTAWNRLGARIAETLRLALPDEPAQAGVHWLQHGSLNTGLHRGLGWVEMARGLLIHQVQLDGAGPQACVLDCQVLAPTEWNFHPQGGLAFLLESATQTAHAEQSWRILAAMASYDPCVQFELCHINANQVAPHA